MKLKLALVTAATAAALSAPLAHAATVRLVVPGTTYVVTGVKVGKGKVDDSQIGANWLPGTTPEVVSYPESAIYPSVGQSAAIGQQNLNAAILKAYAEGDTIDVAGFSQGGIVVNDEEAYLATDPSAPPADALTFYVFANPFDPGGLGALLPAGTKLLGAPVEPPPDSQYDTIVIYEQYEGFANFPDRPWNLLADANAIAGLTEHTQTPTSLPSDAVEMSQTTDSRGGTTTTYMIPQTNLPLTEPLRQVLGAPVVNDLDNALRPIINRGYSELDPQGPYISYGHVENVPIFKAVPNTPAKKGR
ncbi:MAG TPA: PE-PPE domain-containing protein [Mycobacterium sp.]|nr:PE-PPE domain-containing protein [Mycobacterium sp.]